MYWPLARPSDLPEPDLADRARGRAKPTTSHEHQVDENIGYEKIWLQNGEDYPKSLHNIGIRAEDILDVD